MKYEVSTIEQYIEVIPADRKEVVLKLISIVKEYFPSIKGTLKYAMPTFHPVCAIASQKHHISLYINRVDLIQKYRGELGELKVEKSCIRFKRMDQLPEKAIRLIFDEIAKKRKGLHECKP